MTYKHRITLPRTLRMNHKMKHSRSKMEIEEKGRELYCAAIWCNLISLKMNKPRRKSFFPSSLNKSVASHQHFWSTNVAVSCCFLHFTVVLCRQLREKVSQQPFRNDVSLCNIRLFRSFPLAIRCEPFRKISLAITHTYTRTHTFSLSPFRPNAFSS